MIQSLTLMEIRTWLSKHRTKVGTNDCALSLSEIARMAGLSRQTVYALLRDERSEFGEVAQIRLSRVIQQISADPAYGHTRLMRVELNGGTPRLRFGGQP